MVKQSTICEKRGSCDLFQVMVKLCVLLSGASLTSCTLCGTWQSILCCLPLPTEAESWCSCQFLQKLGPGDWNQWEMQTDWAFCQWSVLCWCPYELSSKAFRSFIREKTCPCSLGCKDLLVSDTYRADCNCVFIPLLVWVQRLKKSLWMEIDPYTSAAGICGLAPSS